MIHTFELNAIERLEEMENDPVSHDDELKNLRENESDLYRRLQSMRYTESVEQQRQKIKNDIDTVLDQIKQVAPSQGVPPADMRDVVKGLVKMIDDDPYLFLNLLNESKERYNINEAFEPTMKFITAVNEKVAVYDDLVEKISEASAPDKGLVGLNYAKERLMQTREVEPYVYENLCERLDEKCWRDEAFERTRNIIDEIDGIEKKEARKTAKEHIESLDIKHQEKIKPVEELRQKIDEKFELLQKDPEINADTSESVNTLFTSYQEMDSAFEENSPPPPIRDKDLSDLIGMRLKLIRDVSQKIGLNYGQKKKLIDQSNSSIKKAIDDASDTFEQKMDTLIPEHLAFLTGLDGDLTLLQEKISKEREAAEHITQVVERLDKTRKTIQKKLGFSDSTISPEEALEDLAQAIEKFARVSSTIQKRLRGFRREERSRSLAISPETVMQRTEVPGTSSDAPHPPKISPAVEAQIRVQMDKMMESINLTGFQRNRNAIAEEIIKMQNQNKDAFEHFKGLVEHKLNIDHSWAPIQELIDTLKFEDTTTQ